MKRSFRKSILATLFALCLVLVMAAGVSAAVIDSGNCGEDVTWSLDENGTLTISGTGYMETYSYSSDGSPWKSYKSLIKKVKIENGVKSIAAYAFYGCTGLTSITIPDSVTQIGFVAFSGCSSLTSVTIPDSVTSIESGAFEFCTGLTSITIPDSVTSIRSFAFDGCSSLTSVTIPASVTSIGDRAFRGCSSLTSVTIPDSVTSIEDGVFGGCSSLTSVTIPDSVTSIEDGVFGGCSSLTLVTIPDSVTSIVDNFFGCTSLRTITVDPNNPSYSSLDGVLFNKTQTSLIRCPQNKEGKYKIPDGTIVIREDAFLDCTGLTSITIPDSVTSIGVYAFWGCTGLTSVTIPDSVTSIGGGVFSGCTGLTSVTIPDSVTSIGDAAFDGCTGLTSVTIPDSVMSIGDYAFDGCTGLTSITIPNSVTSFGYMMLYHCDDLIVYYTGTKEEWNAIENASIVFNSTGENAHIIYNYKPVIGVTLKKTLSIAILNNEKLTPVIEPVDASVKGVIWESSDSSIVAVDEGGTVTTVSEGTAEITVTTVDGNKTAVCKVTVTHNLKKTAAVAATCEKAGNKDYYTCSSCGKLFSDAKGTKEIKKADTVVAALGHKLTKTAAVAATCEKAGNKEYYTCSVCGKLFSDAKGTKEIKKADTVVAALGHLWDDGAVTKEATEKEEGEMTFTCRNDASHVKKEVIPVLNPFRFDDVTDEGKFYFTPVYWAVDHDPQITNGIDTTHFGPDQTCTRGQVVTFLWRAKGCPEPASAKNPFKDVKTTDYFYKAVLWAVENGITNGTSGTTFSPKDPCTRAQVAAFLYRTEGSPAADAKNPFTDVQSGKYYYNAVLWAVAKNITAGTSATTFAPDAPCTRGHIVTFLYRDLAS
ncbi:MAG: leucine-rich repeat protein [Bacillota bacterium]|jgi:hypothetical protein